jgi:hypothetical protein
LSASMTKAKGKRQSESLLFAKRLALRCFAWSSVAGNWGDQPTWHCSSPIQFIGEWCATAGQPLCISFGEEPNDGLFCILCILFGSLRWFSGLSAWITNSKSDLLAKPLSLFDCEVQKATPSEPAAQTMDGQIHSDKMVICNIYRIGWTRLKHYCGIWCYSLSSEQYKPVFGPACITAIKEITSQLRRNGWL